MPANFKPKVEEKDTGSHSNAIEGVTTTTTAFVGLTRRGPFAADKRPKLLTSFADFERIYGGLKDLKFAPATNYVAHAAKAFFDQGGRRLYVARVRTSGVGKIAGAGEKDWEEALRKVSLLNDVSLIAAPGSTELGSIGAIIQLMLIAQADTPRAYRFAVLDIPKGMTALEARDYMDRFDSKSAAFYYPWVVVTNPAFTTDATANHELLLPPSGFICGIYARSDLEHGVFKAPANEEVRGAIGFERQVKSAEQELLNAAGVNCLRYFEGRGYRVWGAHTASSDAEWKYVNLRRYMIYLEQSIDQGTEWTVFAPQGETLWTTVREMISNFLVNEWRSGALQGQKPEQAFFIKCDRTTMTQDDIDQGRLICVIGVALLKPAEFVIFRIGQWKKLPCPDCH